MEEEILTLNSKTNLSCKICDKCCKYRGDIRLTPINILEISKFLKIEIKEFLEKYTYELENEEPEIALKGVGKEKICVLNDEISHKCKINKVKPIQCVMFPLIPIDVDKDLFINMKTCPLSSNKKISVNKWLNGNNKIYKRNKRIYIKWIQFIEEIQIKWKTLSKQKQDEIKKKIFEEYNLKENYEKQILKNLKEARETLYKK